MVSGSVFIDFICSIFPNLTCIGKDLNCQHASDIGLIHPFSVHASNENNNTDDDGGTVMVTVL